VIAYNEAAPHHRSVGDADPAVASTPASMKARSPRFIAERFPNGGQALCCHRW
jgi:hypothetical protein